MHNIIKLSQWRQAHQPVQRMLMTIEPGALEAIKDFINKVKRDVDNKKKAPILTLCKTDNRRVS